MHWLAKLTIILLLNLVFAFVWATKIEAVAVFDESDAGPVVFSDDFSDASLAKWRQGRSAGGQWQVINGILRGKVVSSSSITELLPKPEYWYEGWGNYRFSLDMMPVSGIDRNVGWNYQDARNWYEAHFVGSLVEIYRLMNGQLGYVSDHQFFLTPQVWHKVVVEVNELSMKLWVDGHLVADVVDWYEGGRQGSIALKVGAGAVAPSEVWFDNIQVELLSHDADQSLGVGLVMQSDPRWKNELYDHGEVWTTDPTINRWGCALTSLVMILHYYGFTNLPDGQLITPATLNTWLIGEPDGYVADGWVNWLAAERLTRKLVREVRRSGLPLRIRQWWPETANSDLVWEKIRAEIAEQKPAIVALENHFLVAQGITNDGAEILVRDPWYEVTTLGQHVLANRPAKSLRLIESYGLQPNNAQKGWLLATRGSKPPILRDELGEMVEGWEEWHGPERGAVGDFLESHSDWRVWWHEELSSSEYELELTSLAESSEFEATWYSYGSNETVLIRKLHSLGSTLSQKVVITVDGQTSWPDENGLIWSWQELQSWWESLFDGEQIADLAGWIRVRYLLKLTADSADLPSDVRYRHLLAQTAEYYLLEFTDPVMQELLSRLPLTGSKTPEVQGAN